MRDVGPALTVIFGFEDPRLVVIAAVSIKCYITGSLLVVRCLDSVDAREATAVPSSSVAGVAGLPPLATSFASARSRSESSSSADNGCSGSDRASRSSERK